MQSAPGIRHSKLTNSFLSLVIATRLQIEEWLQSKPLAGSTSSTVTFIYNPFLLLILKELLLITLNSESNTVSFFRVPCYVNGVTSDTAEPTRQLERRHWHSVFTGDDR